ncbi:MAG: hypothetical protein M3322_13500 [Actinomycetota bacterium]|nr:hypothetical protein [Actinomycetota bacterium]
MRRRSTASLDRVSYRPRTRTSDGAQFAGVETAGRATESLRIDDRGLLDENARLLALEGDDRAKVAGRALTEVGETSTVLRSRN